MKISRDIVSRIFPAVDFAALVDDLVIEIEMRNYLITRVNNIDNVLSREEQVTGFKVGFRHYKIIEFCNLNRCSELISSHLLAGVFMPTRFIAYQSNGDSHFTIAFLKPTAFAHLFASEPLMLIATEMERDMHDVLDEMAF